MMQIQTWKNIQYQMQQKQKFTQVNQKCHIYENLLN